jgi:Cu(I)/Ag(I) efflux system membrane fusion protein
MSAPRRPQGTLDKLRAVTKRARWIVAAGAIVATAGVVWAVAAARGGRDSVVKPASRTAGGMAGMEGMGGMDMGGGGSVRLTPQQIAQFGVSFGGVEERMLESTVRTVGVVSFDETRMAKVAPKFGGYVERLYVDFTGKPVRRGEPLLEIFSPELLAAQEELLLARQVDRTMGESSVPGVPAGSTDLLAAAKRRLRLWDISDAQIEEVLRTGRARRTLTLYAPVSGVVVEKMVVRGQAVDAGMTLYTLADLSRVWIDIELREADASAVQPGAAADIELAAVPGVPLEGRVEYVYPTMQQETRTLRARVAVPNGAGRLKPGMYATVNLTTPTRRALTLPTSAVVRTGERSLVFVDMGGGELMPHDVETGRVAGDYTEVLTGVEPGQRVVTSAQFLLESESNIGEVMKSMVGQTGTMEMGDMKGMPTPGSTKADEPKGTDMKGADMKGMPGMPAPKAKTPPAAPR